MNKKFNDVNLEEDLDVLDLDEEDVFYEEDINDIEEPAVVEEAYEEETFEDEVYEDEVYEDEVYEDEVYEDEVYEEEVYEDAVYEDETDEYDEMDAEEYDDSEEAFGLGRREKRNRPAGAGIGFLEKIKNMDTMDKLIMSLGCLVLVLAIVAVGVFASYKISDGQVLAFSDMGNEIDKISLIGESGLLAVTDATMAKIDALEEVKEEEEEEEEEDTKGSINVQMAFTSIQKDLKIKFVNRKSGKLIAGIPFEVSLVTPSGKTLNWKDEDKDGVIYYKNIEAGEYKISMVELEGEIYEKYIIDTKAYPATVKKDIAYTKIDVSDEIKDESEINAAEEDTALSNKTESTLTDTVAYVQTSKIPAGKGYEEVNKSLIVAPTTTASLSTAAYMPYAVALAMYTEPGESMPRTVAGITISPATATVEVGKTTTLQVSNQLEGSTITWSSDNEAVATVNGGTITGVSVGTCTVKASDQNGQEATCQVTVTAPAVTLAVTPQTAEVEVGKTVTLSANETVTWSSDNSNIASVDGNGVVTGVAEGTAVITATANGGATATATITVKPVASALKITLDKDKLDIAVGETYSFKATVTGQVDATAGKMQWESADNAIATVDANGKLTALKAGNVIITASYTENSTTVTAKCTVTINSVTYLKTTSNQEVYVLKDGQYVKATASDYGKADAKFYIYTDIYNYLGWQTFNGKTYYYGPDYKKVTGEQVIMGAKYVFDADGALVSSSGVMGIDVSKWNGTIDWKSVKQSGINYVIIRCGYRGTSTGALVEDPKYKANIKGATDAGLKVGVYFFSQAVDEIEAVQEASMVLSLVSGYKISYPIFLDVEAASNGRANNISKDMRTKVCKAFCQTIQNSGYTAGVYANKDWLTNKIDASQLGSYKIWLAQYAAKPSYTGRYEMWQYKDTGSVPGISGHVDLNLSYLGY